MQHDIVKIQYLMYNDVSFICKALGKDTGEWFPDEDDLRRRIMRTEINTFKDCDIKITTVKFFFDENRDKTKDIVLKYDFDFPATDIVGQWHPVCGTDRAVKADWFLGQKSMASISAPVLCFFNGNSMNRHTIALSETKQIVTMKYGVHEEDGTMRCHTEILLPRGFEKDEYILKIWESEEKEPYWETLSKVSKLWEEDQKLKIMEVPDCVRETMYSFWYSQHQNVSAESVEKECERAAKLGFKSVIIDDGWQTDDNNRGYSFCGDWEPSPNKFPDFPAHVKKVQNMGLKYIMWFSVPFLGMKAKMWETFKDKILCYDDYQQAAVLDIRYPEVRDYLKAIYRKAVAEWGLDGLKLDFIDEFYMRPESPVYKEGMDYADVQEALDVLLTEVTEELRAIRSDIMIEFRQKYIGPQIRKYGNFLRVIDCPLSGLTNRVGTIDLRLLSGDTATHSDMLMWHKDERPEDAAHQIISSIFATVQISVNLADVSDEIEKMLKFWKNFMEENVNLLQCTQIKPLEPENLYPEVKVENDKVRIQVNYSKGRVVNLCDMPEKMYYIHGAKSSEVLFKLRNNQKINWKIFDCMGNVLNTGCFENEKWGEIKVPTSGMVIFE